MTFDPNILKAMISGGNKPGRVCDVNNLEDILRQIIGFGERRYWAGFTDGVNQRIRDEEAGIQAKKGQSKRKKKRARAWMKKKKK